MNNIDVNKLMDMLSKMDKKDIENGLAQVSKVLNSKDKNEILKNINQKLEK